MLANCFNESKLIELLKVAGRSDRTKFRNQVINPLLEAGLIEMTIPAKPNSRLQKYRLTKQGQAWLEQQSKHKQ